MRKHFLVDFFACFLIPAYTLLFAGSMEWFSTNFSVIAVTGEDHFRGFFLWGVLVGSYFLGVLGAVAPPGPPGRLGPHRRRVRPAGGCAAAALSAGISAQNRPAPCDFRRLRLRAADAGSAGRYPDRTAADL